MLRLALVFITAVLVGDDRGHFKEVIATFFVFMWVKYYDTVYAYVKLL